MTFAVVSFLNTPGSIYINTNNTIYVPSSSGTIFIWHEGDTGPSKNLTAVPSTLVSVFAASNGEVFAGASMSGATALYKWAMNTATSTVFANTSALSYGLFIDDVNRLYYSIYSAHVVMRLTLNDSLETNTTVAGTGTFGSMSTELSNPMGIFVTTDYTLFVADSNNHRIQLFLSGHMNATTVAGFGATGTIFLYGPSAVVLDAGGYMFIVDRNYNRVVGQGPGGFRCIIACTQLSGPEAYKLSGPSSLSFDSYGNIFVVDTDNNRIQKFLLSKNSCGEFCKS